MATKTICDVKSCQKVIESPDQIPQVVTIGAKMYDLCQQCHNGLQKFISEELGGGKTMSDVLTKQTPQLPTIKSMPNLPSYGGIQVNPQYQFVDLKDVVGPGGYPMKWFMTNNNTHYFDPNAQVWTAQVPSAAAGVTFAAVTEVPLELFGIGQNDI